MTHLREREKSNSNNERPDPTENLCMPVRLKPCRGDVGCRMSSADCKQIPNTEKCAWKQQEEKPRRNESGQEPLERDFARPNLNRFCVRHARHSMSPSFILIETSFYSVTLVTMLDYRYPEPATMVWMSRITGLG